MESAHWEKLKGAHCWGAWTLQPALKDWGLKTKRGRGREWLDVWADRLGQGLCKQRLYLCSLLGNRVQNRQGWEGKERDEGQSGGKRWEEEGEEERIL